MDDRLDRKDAVFHIFHIFMLPHNVGALAMSEGRNGMQLPLVPALIKMGERKNKIKHSGDRMKIKETFEADVS